MVRKGCSSKWNFISSSKEPRDFVRDSRKRKVMVNDLTTNMDEIVLNWGLVPHQLNSYLIHLLNESFKKYLEKIYEDTNSKNVIHRQLYEVFFLAPCVYL